MFKLLTPVIGLSGYNLVWVMVAAALVFFMQAGFAVLETGLTRAKNAGNIMMKNLMDFVLGSIVFFLLGYALMHGQSAGGVIGVPNADFLTDNIDYAKLIFQTVFCATAATIVSGAMAERTNFACYCVYSLIITAFVYPVSGHWIWGGGWLAQMGFHDFAGSTAVHLVGGLSALIGAAVVGARIGKYGKDGKPRAIPGHNLPMAALGVFILWFCWFGFNGGSTYGVDGVEFYMTRAFVTTNLAAVAGCAVCLLITWKRYKKPDLSMCLNGVLAGLVGVTAGADTVSPMGALAIGAICGITVIFVIELLDKKIKIDDPVGAVGVHCACGALGTILVGVFSDEIGLWAAAAGRISWGEAFAQLGTQILGVAVVAAWVCATMIPLFVLLKKKFRLRVPANVEIDGLDIHEHNLASAYAGFTVIDFARSFDDAPPAAPAPAAIKPETKKDAKMTKISMVIRQEKLAALKEAMYGIGVTGITVTQVMGAGTQKGMTNPLYRGAPVEVTLLPKLEVEMVVSAVPVETVIETAAKTLRTGSIGDGKIFTSDIEHVVRIRTGDTDYAALQDAE